MARYYVWFFRLLGDFSQFCWEAIWGLCTRRPGYGTILPTFYFVGASSVTVIGITGIFIGMVLAVQAYSQFSTMGMASRLGQIINISIIRELGPVLAATMLAGRVGSAMAAQLATMRVTEQIDALSSLGVNPIHYLVVPRILACVLLIPLLTIIANLMGIMGGAAVCTYMYHVDEHTYWLHSQGQIGMWDLSTGLIKPMFFGVAIALISCHRGFRSTGGADGVGKAATEAFVWSFIAILALDLALAMILNDLHEFIWPRQGTRFS